MRFFCYLLIGIAVVLWWCCSFAQEMAEPSVQRGSGGQGQAQENEGAKQEGAVRMSSFRKEVRLREKLIIFIGNVEIEYKEVSILADSVVAFLGEKGEIERIYAEGAVLVRRGRERISANAFYYDFHAESGKIVDGLVVTTREALQRFSAEEERFLRGAEEAKAQEVELFIRAKLISIDKPRKYLAEDVTITTCSLAQPHWGLKSSRASVDSTGEMEARGTAIYLGWLSVALFPIRWQRDWRMPLQRLTLGSSTRLGSYALSEWRLLSGKSYDILAAIDDYSKRGTGVGLTATYKDKEESRYYGLLKGYYIHDRGEDVKDVPLEVTERYRASFLHSHQISQGTRLDAEFSKASDSGFFGQYFEREAKEGRPRETYLYLRSARANFGGRLFAKFRTEDFFTETEYLPEARADLISQPLFAGFYFGGSLEAASLRKKYEASLSLPEEEAGRIDFAGTLSRPLSAGRYASFNPFFTTRLSGYSANAYDQNSVSRTALTAGLSASSQVSRNFPTKSEFLNLDSLIHVFSPHIAYSNTFKNTLPPEHLYQFDQIDSVKEEEKITLLLTNKFLTRETARKGKVISEFLSLDLEISLFPHPKRDNDGYNFSDLGAEMRLKISPRFWLTSEFLYNTEDEKTRSGNVSLLYLHSEYLNLLVSGYYSTPQDFLVALAGSVKLSEKWQIGVKYQYNLEVGNYSLQSYTLTRTLHCWIIEGGFQMERETGEKKFVFSFSPLSVFEAKRLKSAEMAYIK